MSSSNFKCVMIIAGEASGDEHGAKVVAAMRERYPDLFFVGIGGRAMREAGVRILVEADSLAVVGITEIFAKAASLIKGISIAKKLLTSLRPDLLILIDFPDFNLHIAATARKAGVPVLYYISPQIWAWRAGRIKKIRDRVDHMAVILPFEANFYNRYQVPVTFVGHPLLDTLSESPPRSHGQATPEHMVIGFLPGSRDKEVIRLLPEMLKAADLLKVLIPGARFLLSQAPSVKKELFSDLMAAHGISSACDIVPGDVHRVFARSTLVVAASGTVTLEAAIAGIPMVIAYKVSPLSNLLGRMLIRGVKYIGLPNLIAGKEIVPELIQEKATAQNITDTVYGMITRPTELEQCRESLLKLRQELGGPGASRQVAEIAAGMLKQAKASDGGPT